MNEVMPLQTVVELARKIPRAPLILPQLMELLTKPDGTDAKHIQAIIMKDSGLVSSVLRIANSAHFSKSSGCESVADAVVRIGFREVYRLTVSSVAGRWLNQSGNGYGWQPGDLCKHSLCVAVASEYLAKNLGTINSGLAYTAGLLHDIGKLALAHACADQFEQVRLHQASANISWRQAEHDILGYDHTDVARILMLEWAFPQSLVQVASFYPRPRLALPEFQPLVLLVHAAKHLALHLGKGVGEEGFCTELDEELLRQAGYTPELMERLLPEILTSSEKLIAGTFAGIA